MARSCVADMQVDILDGMTELLWQIGSYVNTLHRITPIKNKLYVGRIDVVAPCEFLFLRCLKVESLRFLKPTIVTL